MSMALAQLSLAGIELTVTVKETQAVVLQVPSALT